MQLLDQMDAQGYIVVRGLLDPQDIAGAREALSRHFAQAGEMEGLGLHQPDAAIAVEAMSALVAHPAIIQTFSELFGGRRPVFTGNCDAHCNMLSWWHKDTGKSYQTWAPDSFFDDRHAPLIRAGIYLQDHVQRDGLSVKQASHRWQSKEAGDIAYVPTRAGDVIFFDIRLTHAGQLADGLERQLLRLSRHPATRTAAKLVKDVYGRLIGRQTKYSVFFTYGSPCPATRGFIGFERAQRVMRSPALRQDLSPELVRLLTQSGAATEG